MKHILTRIGLDRMWIEFDSLEALESYVRQYLKEKRRIVYENNKRNMGCDRFR